MVPWRILSVSSHTKASGRGFTRAYWYCIFAQASWRIFTPALQRMAADHAQPEPYEFGSRGPSGADALARKFGMSKFGGGLTPYVYLTPAVDPTASR